MACEQAQAGSQGATEQEAAAAEVAAGGGAGAEYEVALAERAEMIAGLLSEIFEAAKTAESAE